MEENVEKKKPTAPHHDSPTLNTKEMGLYNSVQRYASHWENESDRDDKEDGTASGEPLACQSNHLSEHVSSGGKEGDLLI